MTKNAAITVHTHWDREWYLTNEGYTARLLRIMPTILSGLESGQIDTFLFDGQTAALEDLLTHGEPGLAQRVIHYIRLGRINIGPWYVMPDEFLCSGESLIRNIEEGLRLAQEHGETEFLGYLPDTFGHIAQMPQIFRGFDIDKAVIWRGVAIQDDIFEWRAANGDSVTCLFLPQGYYQQPFSKEDYVEAVSLYFDALADKVPHVPLLLTQGGDHLVPPADLKDRIAHYNSAQDKYRLSFTTLAEHIDKRVSAKGGSKTVLNGELRANSNAFLLPDVLSTRRYIKRLNQQAEDRLMGQIEPLLAAVNFKNSYPDKYLRDTWKLLLQQHAHDSICGCSIDEVHQEMLVRFRRIEDRLNALQTMACEEAGLSNPYFNRSAGPSPFADDSMMTVFNPSLKRRAGWQQLNVFLQGDQAMGLSVTDETGREYKTVLCGVNRHRAFQTPIDDFPQHKHGFVYALFVHINTQGWESRTLHFSSEPLQESIVGKPALSDGDAVSAEIANGLVALRVTASGICIDNLQSGETIESAMSILSEGDAGDSYNFSPPLQPWSVQAEIAATRARKLGAYGDEIELALRLPQPASLDAARLTGTDDQVISQGTLILRLLAGEAYIRASLRWSNLARDHRLRLVLPLNEKVQTTISDSAFALIERPVVYRKARKSIAASETDVCVNPSYSYIEAGPLRLAHLAMQEFEILDDGAQDRLAITLIRSVGWLSRQDLITRGAGAGPDFETPQAQCLGEDWFSFLLSVGSEGALKLSDAECFRRPLLFLTGKGQIAAQSLQLTAPDVQISSCRRRGDEVEVRLFNPTDEKLEYVLAGGEARRTELSGKEVVCDTNQLEAGEIVTLRLSTGSR